MRRIRKLLLLISMLLLCQYMAVPAQEVRAELVTEGEYEYYQTDDGTYLKNSWMTIDGKRVYFDGKGHRVKSAWKKIKGDWYYFNGNGNAVKSQWIGDYYVGKNYKMLTSTWVGRYYVNKEGKWIKNRWVSNRYVGANGKYIKNAWKKIGKYWYYFNEKGRKAVDQWIGDYYVGSKGRMLTKTWVGNKYVDASGKRVRKTSISLTSPSAIIMEGDTGKVIYRKNASTKRANASTTKIMTAILALENNKLTDKVTFSSYASSQEAVKLYASAGEKFYMKDMLYALLIPSYNDVAVAIAEKTAGNVTAFASMMNKKATAIGCKNTTFVTPNGLDQGNHGTTAYDLAVMARYAMQKSTFRKIVKTRSYGFTSISSGKTYYVSTTDELLGNMAGVIGVKTGYTRKAGYCFVGAYNYNGKTYYTVVLGASSSDNRWNDTKKLMNYIADNCN